MTGVICIGGGKSGRQGDGPSPWGKANKYPKNKNENFSHLNQWVTSKCLVAI